MALKKRWLLPENGNLYKANLHCHSTVSDGSFTPDKLKEMYIKNGYQAIAYTDHQVCIPHTELTDENFVALTGLEIAFGIGADTSVHICGISRNPDTKLEILNEKNDDIEKINSGIKKLNELDFITTLNHPRWSGISWENLGKIESMANIEVLNAYETVLDGYGDSSAIFELELRRGRNVCPVATDDSHKILEHNKPGYEYFKGFTYLKAPKLTHDSLINALDNKAFYASTGPKIYNMWLENGILYIECSPVCGVYVHGKKYSHRYTMIKDNDTITKAEFDIGEKFADSDYFFVKIVDTKGARAWTCPYSPKEI